MDLIEFLRANLSPEELAELRAEVQVSETADYDDVIRRVGSKLKPDEEHFRFARARVELRYKDLLELPKGRRLTILGNSSPILLLVLLRHLIECSYEARFCHHERSSELAMLAVEVAEAIAAGSYLSVGDSADLMAEALAYLGNARRINSDLPGAESCFAMARAYLEVGTGDRTVKAVILRLLAFLRVDQGRCQDAVELIDREIPLRRLLGDQEELGIALIQRGWASCWTEDTALAADYFKKGVALVKEPRLSLQALHALAEALAREGHSFDAWGSLMAATLSLRELQGEWFEIQDRWIRGLIRRASGELQLAGKLLRSVCDELRASGRTFLLAIASLDLACVYTAQGKLDEVEQLAAEAYAIFKAEGLEERALTAVVVLQEAIEAERVTEGLAVAVANFLARFPYNKALRFEWKGE